MLLTFWYCPVKGRVFDWWRSSSLLNFIIISAPELGPRLCCQRGERPVTARDPDTSGPGSDTGHGRSRSRGHKTHEWRVESGHPPSVNSYLSRPYIISRLWSLINQWAMGEFKTLLWKVDDSISNSVSLIFDWFCWIIYEGSTAMMSCEIKYLQVKCIIWDVKVHFSKLWLVQMLFYPWFYHKKTYLDFYKLWRISNFLKGFPPHKLNTSTIKCYTEIIFNKLCKCTPCFLRTSNEQKINCVNCGTLRT